MAGAVDMVETIKGMLQTNSWIMNKQSEGLTHEDSLLQLPFRGNCLNWVLGHLLEGRDRMLKLVGEDPFLSDEEGAMYKSGSEPITNDDHALKLETLLAHHKSAYDKFAERLELLSEDDLLAKPKDSEQTVLQQLHGLAWHETYHVGQTEILRQLTGVDDKVI